MNTQQLEDIKDTALKLNEIRFQYPEDFFYLKGWIHCLLQKENSKKQTYTKISKDLARENK